MRKLLVLLTLTTATFLSGCTGDALEENFGGAGGSAGAGGAAGTGGSGAGGTTGASALVSSVTLIASPAALPTAADTQAEAVTISALVRDANNNALAAVPVIFSASSGLLNVTSSSTSGSGRATAELTTGGDQSNRNITITATAGSKSGSLVVAAAGTVIQLEGDDVIGSGTNSNYKATVRNSAAEPIAGMTLAAVTSNGNGISPAAQASDADGQAVFAVSGQKGGVETIRVSGPGGLEASKSVTVSTYKLDIISPAAGTEIPFGQAVDVKAKLLQNAAPAVGQQITFSTTRGALSSLTASTGADGIATIQLTSTSASGAGGTIIGARGPSDVQTSTPVEMVATTPASIVTQASPATVVTGKTSTITATVRDANNNPVKNQIVTFSLVDNTGGRLSATSARTGSLGDAAVVYTAGNSTSAANGVQIQASLGSIAGTAQVTVGGESLRVTLGTSSRIFTSDDQTTYGSPFVALVTDAAGNPPATPATVTLKVLPLSYRKGVMGFVDTNDDDEPDTWVAFPSAPSQPGSNFGCLNEDVNYNGIRDGGEDFNGNGRLDPGNVASVSGTAQTDTTGAAYFTITYPTSYARWVLMRVIAVATVGGTETTEFTDVVLDISLAHAQDKNTAPSGVVSPGGTGSSCANPN